MFKNRLRNGTVIRILETVLCRYSLMYVDVDNNLSNIQWNENIKQ